ncbi:MAG TPA: D-aminoacyl-tRNA deacylase [Candidatus Hydrogenedentes bacterium]|nr:D-tyrosyl-tRNA(Tyr) deacylase [Candidatus Hydrogenedentota bacterium]HOK90834.1 D-aminoacyl-tRNA deacylase [Candidatus Hydrogenedentota bacterium]
MRAVVQRVARASVTVDDQVVGAIGPGLLVLLGVEENDGPEDAAYIVDKVANLRIFPDENSRMNRSVLESGGAILIISQFTLHGDCRRGRRPSFTAAAKPDKAVPLYEEVVGKLRAMGLQVETGVFGAHMMVSLVNDGPVTILLDSSKLF